MTTELPVCRTCKGVGDGGGFDRNGSHALREYVEYPCRDCGGTGWYISEPLLQIVVHELVEGAGRKATNYAEDLLAAVFDHLAHFGRGDTR